MARTRTPLNRVVTLLAVGVLTVVGAALLPQAGAQASTSSFSVSVTGGYNNSQALGTATGSLTATSGGTSLSYSVQICGQSTYPNSRVTIKAGSGSVTHYANAGSCSSYSGTVTSTYGFSSATVTLVGATFYPGNTYTEYTKTRTVTFTGTPPPTTTTTTQPANPVTNSFSLAVKGGYNNSQSLGTASGSVTATRGAKTASYSVQICGQSTYPNSRVTIQVGSGSVTHYANAGSCSSYSGTVTSTSGISTGTVTLYGSTFYPGNTYTTYSKSRSLYF